MEKNWGDTPSATLTYMRWLAMPKTNIIHMNSTDSSYEH